MTSKNKTSQPDTPSSDEKIFDADAPAEIVADGEKTDELEEVTDPIAADMAAADEDYIMEVVSPIFPGLDDEDDNNNLTSEDESPENDAESTTDLEKVFNDAALTQDLSVSKNLKHPLMSMQTRLLLKAPTKTPLKATMLRPSKTSLTHFSHIYAVDVVHCIGLYVVTACFRVFLYS